MQFKDIDSIIEKKLSLSISEIFKKKGEKFFRDIEEKETINYLNKNKVVIALGGGAFMNEKIISLTCGIIFGIGLVISGMTNPAKVISFLPTQQIWILPDHR